MLTKEIYALASRGDLARDFGLRDQMRRAAVSIMSNIAEGFARNGDREFCRYLDIARGSAAEVQSLLFVAEDAGYVSTQERLRLEQIIGPMLLKVARLSEYLKGRLGESADDSYTIDSSLV